ncbi:hypothetical protein Leryth_010625 [Lithospermum erythrorhizon]|nr:hypothetical protein Leryth_010625 [Lithospermum erythrorhizon]
MMFLRFCSHSIHIITFTILVFTQGFLATTFTIVNKCGYAVWPGILANADSPKLETTGFELGPSATRSFEAPPHWSGRLWGRTSCTFDPNSGQGSCGTGDCGSNQVECNGAGASTATLIEFSIGSGTQDFYDVSLVDGYNLPVMVEPDGGSGSCMSTGCVKDLNRMCPEELRVGEGQGCRSACVAFGTPEYCCSGAYSSPSTCASSSYSQFFKSACPRSYSYAYDDPTSTFTCTGADYTITFCPSLSSRKSSMVSTGHGSTEDNGSLLGDNPGSTVGSWISGFLTGNSSSSTLPYVALFYHTTLPSFLISFFIPLLFFDF